MAVADFAVVFELGLKRPDGMVDRALGDAAALATDLPPGIGPPPSMATPPAYLASETGEVLKSEIDALLNLRLGKLALPGRLLAIYEARTSANNRKMMASWCAWVACINIPIGLLDPFVVPPALLKEFVAFRLIISLAFGLCSAAIRNRRFAGREKFVIIVPCMIMMILAGSAGLTTQNTGLLFGYLTNGIVIIYTGIMFLRLSLADAQWLARLAVAVMGIFLVASGGGDGAEKLQNFAFYGGAMIAVVQTRKVQNLYHHRMFLMKLRDEINNSEASALNERLSSIAYTDKLTGLPNRRFFDEICASMSDTTKNLFPLSLCMVDIDHFKKLNDNLGHLQGDRCLRLVAAAIRDNLRGSRDIVARFGGEEFVIVLPGAGHDDARAIAERVRAAIESLAHPNPGSPFGIVTASFGVASIQAPQLSIQALMSEADKALYRAKKAGRNKVAA
jgi:diguanylate cyclase (GGDEF)-like protein